MSLDYPHLKFGLVGLLLGCLHWALAAPLSAQEAQWIWYPVPDKNEVPLGSTYYRNTFVAEAVEQAQILIAADDQYDLFLNNKKIGTGAGTEALDRFDVTANIKSGKNVIAIRVENLEGGTGALAARVQVKEKGKGWRSYSTDRTWKTSTGPLPIWKFQFFNDSGWKNAQSFGKLGSTPPWDAPAQVVKQSGQSGVGGSLADDSEAREPDTEFFVEDVFTDEEVGSIIAFEFDEFGDIIASPEAGGLVKLDTDSEIKSGRVTVLTDEVSAVQGILPLNGQIYVTGIYRNQAGLYLLKDDDRDDRIEEIVEILSFKGFPGEHGAHGLVLGPDGKIHVTLGNHVAYNGQPASNSPYTRPYEGSIVKRYEDPGGHAKGIEAPGGTVLRTDLTGDNVEVFAGGLRNSYDLAFNHLGDLFTYDSDMETDVGLSWYRPANVYHVIPGADFGWRSGWAKWPEYYLDMVPSIANTGRGSPTGMVEYNHVMFPLRYQKTIFLADWSRGRIYNIKLTRKGASYDVQQEVFVEGSPLNVTDLAVGPDGALYFATGGRMTNGGIYRVRWKGEVPEAYRSLDDNLSRIIRQPQLNSAYARQKLAELQSRLGEEWDRIVVGVAISNKNPEDYRTQAIDLMTLFGPAPTREILIRLSQDESEVIRAKAVRAIAFDPELNMNSHLVGMLDDPSSYVRRLVCESLSQLDAQVDYNRIRPLLLAADRMEAYAARELLERQPVEDYRETVIESDELSEFLRGSLALMTATRDQQNATVVLDRVSQWLEKFISDSDFLELLRLVQVTIELGEIQAEQVPDFARKMADEFPCGNPLMNLELSRILASLQVDAALQRLTTFLKSSQYTAEEKLDVAMHLQLIRDGWTTNQKLALIDFLEKQIGREESGNHGAFIRTAIREYARNLTQDEAITVLKKGQLWPNAALSAFYSLPRQLDEELIAEIRKLDRRIQKETEETFTFIKKGIIAVLAQGGAAEGVDYLKEIWRRDAERRQDVAIAFSLQPNSGTWPYLIASINEVEEEATEVMRALLRVPQKPEGAKYYKLVIVKAQTLGESGKIAAASLLEFWTGVPSRNKLDPAASIEGWKEWFAQTYPDEAPAEIIQESESQKWTVSLLEEVLAENSETQGSKTDGRVVFKKAQCANCHRFSNYGESIGPDLTTIARRFTTREILESIIHPSNVISDQYRSEMIATVDGRQVSGIVTPGPDGSMVVLQSDGTKLPIAADNIEARKKTRTSVMPGNLLESLSEQEIVDLFTYLGLLDEDRIAGKPRFITR